MIAIAKRRPASKVGINAITLAFDLVVLLFAELPLPESLAFINLIMTFVSYVIIIEIDESKWSSTIFIYVQVAVPQDLLLPAMLSLFCVNGPTHAYAAFLKRLE